MIIKPNRENDNMFLFEEPANSICCDLCGKVIPEEQAVVGEWGDYCSPECEYEDSFDERIVEAYDTLEGEKLKEALAKMGLFE